MFEGDPPPAGLPLDACGVLRHRSAANISSFTFVTGINRMTGRTFVSIGFDSPEARAATEDAGGELRAKAAEVAGASTVKVDNREVVFAKIVRRPQQN